MITLPYNGLNYPLFTRQAFGFLLRTLIKAENKYLVKFQAGMNHLCVFFSYPFVGSNAALSKT